MSEVNLSINSTERIVTIETEANSVNIVEEIYRKIQQWLYHNIWCPEIVRGEGNIDLGSGQRSPRIFIFLDGWKIKFETSQEVICLKSGNLTGQRSDRSQYNPIMENPSLTLIFEKDLISDLSNPENLSNKFIAGFQTNQKLGHGGSAVVYSATTLKNLDYAPKNQKVAMKIFKEEILHIDGQKTRIKKISKSMSNPDFKSNPHLSKINEYREMNEIPYLILEFIDGVPLDKEIETRLEQNQEFELEEIIKIFKEIFDAMSCLHMNNIIHRDIKPENIILHPTRGAVLLDFGIIKDFSDPTQFTPTNKFIFSWNYAAPEMFKKKTKKKSDFYMLGGTLYHIITRHKPHDDIQKPFINDRPPLRLKKSDCKHKKLRRMVNRLLQHSLLWRPNSGKIKRFLTKFT